MSAAWLTVLAARGSGCRILPLRVAVEAAAWRRKRPGPIWACFAPIMAIPLPAIERGPERARSACIRLTRGLRSARDPIGLAGSRTAGRGGRKPRTAAGWRLRVPWASGRGVLHFAHRLAVPNGCGLSSGSPLAAYSNAGLSCRASPSATAAGGLLGCLPKGCGLSGSPPRPAGVCGCAKTC